MTWLLARPVNRMHKYQHLHENKPLCRSYRKIHVHPLTATAGKGERGLSSEIAITPVCAVGSAECQNSSHVSHRYISSSPSMPVQCNSRRRTSQDARDPRADGRPTLGLGFLGFCEDTARMVLTGLALFFLSARSCQGALLLRCGSEEDNQRYRRTHRRRRAQELRCCLTSLWRLLSSLPRRCLC